MNHVYRLVWNHFARAYVPAPEIARAQGKSSTRSAVQGAVALLSGFFLSGVFAADPAGVISANGNTVVHLAPNGVPVVDIARTNGAGLSHNQFTQYNIDSRGVVLNNNSPLTNAGALPTQLAGRLESNPNLMGQANLILNEVVAASRSMLAGFTEVAGGKADVVVANPWGVTCNGCGFINTDRVLLTTGLPQFGGIGQLNGVLVQGGDILLQGNGLDASQQNVLDLVARSIRIDGQLNARDLALLAGLNTYGYAQRSINPSAGTGTPAPQLAIDSTLLGGMYANRIRLTATENGVGVRMLGTAAATADDFTLNAAGKIELTNKISAQRDLAVSYSGTAAAADAILVNGGSAELAARRDLAITGFAGGVTLQDAKLTAEQDLTLTAQSLNDGASAETVRFAGRKLAVTLNGNAAVDRASWGAGGAADLTVGALSVGSNGAKIYAGSTGPAALKMESTLGSINLANASVTATGDVSLQAKSGMALGASGTIDSGDDLQMNWGGTFNNAGQLASRNTLTGLPGATGAKLINSGRLQSDVLKLGQSGQALDVEQTASGVILGKTVSTTATGFNNAGLVQASNALGVSASGALTNTGTGKILNTAAGSALTLSGNSISNAGTIQSVGALGMTAATSLGNSGTLYTVNDGNILTLTTATLDNSGKIESSGALTVAASGLLGNSSTGTMLTRNAARDLQITAGSLDNDGGIQSAALLKVTTSGLLDNSGKLLTTANTGKLTLQTAGLINSGDVQSAEALDITASGALTNSGNLLNTQSGQNVTIGAASLTNSGTVQSAGQLTATITGAVDNQAAGKLLTQNSGGALTMSGSGITNAGTAQSAGALSVTAIHTLTNSGMLVSLSTANGGSGGTLGLTGSSLDNTGTGTVDAAGAATLTSGSTLTNSGNVRGDGTVTLKTGNALTQNSSGKVIAAGNLAVDATDTSFTLNNSGLLQTAAKLSLGSNGHVVGLTNQSGAKLMAETFEIIGAAISNAGRLQATKGGTLSASSLTNSGSSSLILAASDTGNSTFTVSGAVQNEGAMHSNGVFTVKGASVTNTSTAGLSANAALNVEATAGSLSNSGALYSSGDMSLKASDRVENKTGATVNSDAKLTSQSSRFDNGGAIVVSNADIITTASFRNGVSDADLPTIFLDVDNAEEISGARQIKNAEWYCNVFGEACQQFFIYERKVKVQEKLSKPLPAVKPQIVVTNTLAINYGGGTADNNAGVLSAQTINITGSGSFTNRDFVLQEFEYGQRWMDFKHNSTTGAIEWEYMFPTTEQQYDNTPSGGCDDCDDPSWGAGGTWGNIPNPNGSSGRWRDRTPTRDPRGSNSAMAAKMSYKKELAKRDYANSGSGIFAQNLSFTGGTLRNFGATSRQAPVSLNGPGAADAVAGSAASKTASGSAAGALSSSATAVTGIAFAGLNLSLPTNPNGFFVVNRNPAARFLVETNPLFVTDSNFVSSDFFVERYGYNPETVTQRLGDANYEAYLIRQQLITQTGSNLLAGSGSEAAQMQRLMEQAVTQGKSLGLSFGKPLSASQIAGLTQDIVWMEETVVNGQTVLAPRVYLAESTKKNIATGAVIAAAKMNLDVKSLENTGGTLAGTDSLKIKSQGDITNTSGSIKGGDVSLTSTSGSIVNQTKADGRGDKLTYNTEIGKTASIESTKTLALDAKKDIKIIGADVKAAESASLKAGGNITVDTIVDKTATSSASNSSKVVRSSLSNKTVTSEKNIGSGITVGGALKTESGGNTTIAGSKVSAESLDAKAGGSFSVLAKQDKVTTDSSKRTTGIGVGGGVTGSETKTTNDFVGTNAGSTLDIRKDAKVVADGKITLEGSQANIGGSASLKAKDGIEILDGKDERRTTSTTTTTALAKFSKSSDSGSAAASSKDKSGASASASAQASSGIDFEAYKKEVSTTNSGKTSSVASKLNVGGNLDATTQGTLLLRGSSIDAGGDVKLDAKKVEVKTGINEEYSKTTTSSTSYGLFNENEASASAEAGASKRSDKGGAQAKAGASAEAKASSTTTIGARSEESSTNDYKLTNSASSIKSGGNLAIKAKETASFTGAKVEAGGDLKVEAKDIINKAAQDISLSESSSSRKTAGVYIGAEAEASASAKGQAGAGAYSNNKGSAKASASAEASVGLRAATSGESESEKSVTNVTNSFKAGGNITRKAENKILDQGTQIEAGGNIEQSARVIEEEAIHDTTTKTSSKDEMDARIGTYAGASADAGASSSGKASAGADASAGFKASIDAKNSSSRETTGTAVTSKYKAGGSITSKSTEKTTLVGTKFEAGKDVNIEAGSLDYQAAKDFTTSSSSSEANAGEVKVGVAGTAGLKAEGSHDSSDAKSASTKAQAGSITAGGHVKLKTTQGDLSLEGTNVDAKGAVDLKSAGNLDIKAARDTESSSNKDLSISASLEATAGGGGADASASYGQGSSSSSTAKAASIKGGSVSLSGAKDVTLEGTKVDASNGASIEAGGNVNLKAAESTKKGNSIGVSAEIGGSSEKKDGGGSKKTGGAGIGVSGGVQDSVSSDGVSINSGGPLTIKGKTVTNQGAELKSEGGTTVTGKQVQQKKVERNVDMGFDVGAEAGGTGTTKK